MRSHDLCWDGGVHVDRALIPEPIRARMDRRRAAELSNTRENQRYAAELLVNRPTEGSMNSPARVGTRAGDDNGTAPDA